MIADVLIDPYDGEYRQFLWAATFTQPGEGQLERHYSTYGIQANGYPCYMVTPEYDPLYPVYKVVDEFATIAIHLILLEKFDEFRGMWYDALQAALRQAITHAAD